LSERHGISLSLDYVRRPYLHFSKWRIQPRPRPSYTTNQPLDHSTLGQSMYVNGDCKN